MEERMLTREEIALSLLNGMLGSIHPSRGKLAWWEEPGALKEKAEQEACATAFELADLFIRERARQV